MEVINQLIPIAVFVSLIIGVINFFKGNNKEQNDLDKEQDSRLNTISSRQDVTEERVASISDRMNRLESRQESHESLMMQEIKDLEKKLMVEIRLLPKTIVELLKSSR